MIQVAHCTQNWTRRHLVDPGESICAGNVDSSLTGARFLCFNVQHAVKRDTRPVLRIAANLDAVHYAALH